MNNLRREGLYNDVPPIEMTSDNPAVIHSDDVMYDCVLYYSEKSQEKHDILERLELLGGGGKVVSYILATMHRPENTDSIERLTNILRTLAEITSEIAVVLPLHPRTRKVIESNIEKDNHYLTTKSGKTCYAVRSGKILVFAPRRKFLSCLLDASQKNAYNTHRPAHLRFLRIQASA